VPANPFVGVHPLPSLRGSGKRARGLAGTAKVRWRGKVSNYYPMANIHEYPISVDWTGGFNGGGKGKAHRSGHEFPLSVPPEFKGPGEGTNPEELLTAAITGCYSITFGIIAQNRKLPVVSVHTEAVGEVEQAGAQFTYKKITLKPVITLASDATDEHVTMAADMAHKADAYCIVTNAVRGKVEITVEPTIIKG